jgi:hypothetical protein
MAKPSTSSKKTKPLTKSEVLKAVIDSVGEDVSGPRTSSRIVAGHAGDGQEVRHRLRA